MKLLQDMHVRKSKKGIYSIFPLGHLCVVLLFFSLTSVALPRQVDLEEIKVVANLLDRDFDATLHITDFQELWSAVREQEGFVSQHFLDGIADVAKFDSKQKAFFAGLSEMLKSIESLHIALRFVANADTPLVLVMIRFAEESHSDAEQGLSVVEETEIVSNFNVKTKVLPEWTILSNSEAILDSVAYRIEGKGSTKSSLLRDRRFAIAINKADQRDALAFSFFRPSKFPHFFGVEDKQKSTMLQIDELSSGAAFIQLDNSKNCRFICGGFVRNTLPAGGIAELWDSSDGLFDLPPTPFRLRHVSGNAWDPNRTYAARKNTIDRVHGDGSYDKSLEGKYGTSIEKAKVQEFGIWSSSVYLKYISESGFRKSMTFKRLNNHTVAKAFVRESALREKKKGFGEIETEFADVIVFGFDDESMRRQKLFFTDSIKKDARYKKRMQREFEKLKMTGKRTTAHLLAESIENEGFLLSEKWLIYGDVDDLIQQHRFMESWAENQTVEPSANRILEYSSLIDSICELCAFPNAPFSILVDDRISRIGDSFKDYLSKKYKNKKTVDSILRGETFDALKRGDIDFEGDSGDIVAYLLFVAVQKSYKKRFLLFSRGSPSTLNFSFGLSN